MTILSYSGKTANFLEAFKVTQAIFYEIVLNRVIPLQALFYISGLMTTYKWLKSPEQNLNVGKFLLKRYIRFTPAYAFVLALMIITPFWGSGPSWYSHLNPIYNNCKDHWWYNLLYINNYIESDKVCLDHTWVFAVDAQLHIMAVFILIPLKMRPKVGLLGVNFGSSWKPVSVVLTNFILRSPPLMGTPPFLHVKDRYYYAEHSYYRMYSHIGFYCTGVFVAYLVHIYPAMKISKKTSGFLWLVTLLGFWASTCSVHTWRTGIMPSSLLSAVYVTSARWRWERYLPGYRGRGQEEIQNQDLDREAPQVPGEESRLEGHLREKSLLSIYCPALRRLLHYLNGNLEAGRFTGPPKKSLFFVINKDSFKQYAQSLVDKNV
ncbi:nose resistant to fluoxetine protein 6 [Trichonephila inaurata madagascariensis]|uniref:Nose resistant to fluoxetine protein 6 n=1 Tax=Trichonephila inaurata madagascariensis TaxID=2747483 RepID=A0A8X6WXS6_9ARAC|nr:nose resistant to fluoxetine protein 6 [Trichonephila inaurata madagascariensis]